MALDFNTTPYHDDFNDSKNFHRILFRPGRAVQARELTQSQTLLQDQVKKLGDHLFQDGSRVTGASLFSIGEGKIQNIEINQQSTVNHINLQSTFGGTAINVASFVNNFITANTGNTANANIRSLYFCHHSDTAVGTDPDTIYVSFIRFINNTSESANTKGAVNAIVSNSANLQIFSTGDLNPVNLVSTVTATNNLPYGKAKLMGVTEGVFFTNGVFVKNAQQTIAVDKYAANTNATIGFDVTESIVKSTDDTTLLDPALDSSNYLAPGGDRYKISLDLSRKNLDTQNSTLPSLTSTKYIELVRYRNGVLVKNASDTKYSDLGRTLARRTFDESGDYIVDGLEPRITALSNTNTFLLNISKGKAYVKGYEIDTISQVQLPISRARDQESITGHDLQTPYSNFFNITNSNNAVFNSNTSERVELYSSNGVIDGTTLIGEGYVKNIQYVSGDSDSAVNRLHLFGVKKIANTGGTSLPISLTKHIKGMNTGNANSNIHSTSIVVRISAVPSKLPSSRSTVKLSGLPGEVIVKKVTSLSMGTIELAVYVLLDVLTITWKNFLFRALSVPATLNLSEPSLVVIVAVPDSNVTSLKTLFVS